MHCSFDTDTRSTAPTSGAQAMRRNPYTDFRSRMHTQFRHDVFDMMLGRTFGDDEVAGNLTVSAATPNQRGDLPFPSTEECRNLVKRVAGHKQCLFGNSHRIFDRQLAAFGKR